MLSIINSVSVDFNLCSHHHFASPWSSFSQTMALDPTASSDSDLVKTLAQLIAELLPSINTGAPAQRPQPELPSVGTADTGQRTDFADSKAPTESRSGHDSPSAASSGSHDSGCVPQPLPAEQSDSDDTNTSSAAPSPDLHRADTDPGDAGDPTAAPGDQKRATRFRNRKELIAYLRRPRFMETGQDAPQADGAPIDDVTRDEPEPPTPAPPRQGSPDHGSGDYLPPTPSSRLRGTDPVHGNQRSGDDQDWSTVPPRQPRTRRELLERPLSPQILIDRATTDQAIPVVIKTTGADTPLRTTVFTAVALEGNVLEVFRFHILSDGTGNPLTAALSFLTSTYNELRYVRCGPLTRAPRVRLYDPDKNLPPVTSSRQPYVLIAYVHGAM